MFYRTYALEPYHLNSSAYIAIYKTYSANYLTVAPNLFQWNRAIKYRYLTAEFSPLPYSRGDMGSKNLDNQEPEGLVEAKRISRAIEPPPPAVGKGIKIHWTIYQINYAAECNLKTRGIVEWG